MRQTELTGRAQTVLGIIDADSLGVTLPHEHFFTEPKIYMKQPTEATEKRLAHEPLSLENLYWAKLHFGWHLDSRQLMDEKLAIKEALLYKWEGGDTIVDLQWRRS